MSASHKIIPAIVLVPGHSDNTPGTRNGDPGASVMDASGRQVTERSINLVNVDALKKQLEGKGYHVVVMSENPLKYLHDGSGKDGIVLGKRVAFQDLAERAAKVPNLAGVYYVHADANPDKNSNGLTEFSASPRASGTNPVNISAPKVAEGRHLPGGAHTIFGGTYWMKDKLKGTGLDTIPVRLLELGDMTHELDRLRNPGSPAGQKGIAEASDRIDGEVKSAYMQMLAAKAMKMPHTSDSVVTLRDLPLHEGASAKKAIIR